MNNESLSSNDVMHVKREATDLHALLSRVTLRRSKITKENIRQSLGAWQVEKKDRMREIQVEEGRGREGGIKTRNGGREGERNRKYKREDW